ncbi:MAG: 4Fe-4S binding protein [Bacteroidales bacterium]|nr:4Fe-4S binding protein [Bacteroidales bacterium]
MNQRHFANLGILIVVAAAVIFLSWLSMNIWGSNKVETVQLISLQYNKNLTLKQFAIENKLPEKVVLRIFNLKNTEDLNKTLSDFPVNQEKLLTKTNEALAIYAESLSKNWIKIFVKFVLWFLFLALIFVLILKNKITPKNRKWFYLVSFVLFGIILGSDPSPMGTIKDAVTLYAMHHVLFIPRFIALAVFLFMVVSVNKFICAWGCQLGTLQDFIFRLNRNKRDTKGLVKQYKVPFAVSNSIRIGFFVLFTVIAFVWVFDIVEYIDPFKIFNPKVVNVAGWIFIGLILIASLFVYRPWCHFFCPFGLFGWLFERFSFVKIKVKYSDCIACDACSKACPSTVMDTILKQNKTIPDCFACGSCISVCPTNAISLSSGKREKVPEGKFDKK